MVSFVVYDALRDEMSFFRALVFIWVYNKTMLDQFCRKFDVSHSKQLKIIDYDVLQRTDIRMLYVNDRFSTYRAWWYVNFRYIEHVFRKVT